MTVFRRKLPSGGLQCRWGRLKTPFSTNIWLLVRWLVVYN